MKYSSKLSSEVHILGLIDIDPFANLSSDRIVESMKANSSAVRQIMSKLRKSGLINSVRGHP